MPTYDYVCGGCEHTFEAFQSIKANSLKKCPACGEPKLKRLIGTGAGVIFKGSGFYETDYRSDSYKKAAKAEKGDGGDKSASTKGESGGKSEGGSAAAPKEGTSTAPSTPAKSESSTKSTGKQGGDAGKSGASQ